MNLLNILITSPQYFYKRTMRRKENLFFDIRGLRKVKFWRFIVIKNTVKFVEVRQKRGGREKRILSLSTMTLFQRVTFLQLVRDI